ncbi:flippase [Haloferax namakaokahaiae]|uniref:Flippase n=1 Tax=Haloferax namakaokahaiae TaxID=1748331 RepID=A0ABD5ZBI0_9EURY
MSDIAESIGSLAESAVLMMVGSLVGRSLGLVAETLIARELGPELFGGVALAYTIVMTSGNIILLGIHDGVTRLTSAETNSSDKLEFVLAGGITAALAGTIGMIFMGLFSEGLAQIMNQRSLARYLLFIAPYLILFPLSKIIIATLRAEGRSVATVLSRAIAARLGGVGILVCLLFFGWTTGAAITYWLSVPTIIILAGGGFVIRSESIEIEDFSLPSKDSFSNLWQFSWPLALSSIVFLLLSQFDVLMIGYFLDASSVGNYRAIQPLRQAATVVLTSFSFLFLPLATRSYEQGEFSELNRLFTTITKWSVVITLPVILMFVFAADEVVSILFGPAYGNAALPLSILSGGLFLRALVGPNGDVVKAIGHTRFELYSGLSGVAVNFCLNILLIPAYGIAGAAVATVCGYAVYNLLELYLIYREIGISPFSIDILKPVIACTLVVWAFYSHIQVDSKIVSIIVVGVTSAGVTVVSLVATKSIEETDLLLVDRLESRLGRELKRTRQILYLGR